MLNFCTVCDKNYLPKALCLLHSLRATVKQEFTLHWLCADEETFHIARQEPNVKAYSLFYLELQDAELTAAKNNPPSQFGDSYSQYLWSLTPYFTNYILKRLYPGEKLIYCDADIFFYQSPEKILEIIGDKSIGLHTHRPSVRTETIVGHYNIGVTVFTNDAKGMLVSENWKNWLLQGPKNPYYEKYGTCGDQKYAELFETLIGLENICVFDEGENKILHGAPWCCDDLEGKEICFYHFSHFTITETGWSDSYKGEWRPIQYPNVRRLYFDYYELMKTFLK